MDPQWNEILDKLPYGIETSCSYFSERQSRMQYFLGDEDIPPSLIEAALEKGFRRCGESWYRTKCKGCNHCLCYRLSTTTFKPSKSQRRVLRKNTDLRYEVKEALISDEKKALYLRYQHSQHFLKPFESETGEFNEEDALLTMTLQMYDNPRTTRELEVYLEDKLLGFGTIDVAETSISLVYFVFDPDFQKRSLGIYNILKSVEWAQEQGFQSVYLGYYIPEHPKMDYKVNFQPSEMFNSDNQKWTNELPQLRNDESSN
ncbi:MAG: arginyltransferase [Lentisphaeria bacterium]|nr:arginyltransferase [Lentisphaeria bacterium]NQZ67031.1 arginyltransferase [Lentisphaeria bacterium]